jgi:CheY-like chemotaxis protein
LIAASPDRFQIVISDYLMPGFTGVDFVRTLASKYRADQFQAVFLFTGHEDSEPEIATLLADLKNVFPVIYLHKMIPLDELEAVLKKISDPAQREPGPIQD